MRSRWKRWTGTTANGTTCLSQILDQNQAAKFIVNNAVLTFYGYAPTTYTAANYGITVSIAVHTAADSATAGTNTATYGLSAAGQTSGIANYTAEVAGFIPNTTGTLTSGVATINLSATGSRNAPKAEV